MKSCRMAVGEGRPLLSLHAQFDELVRNRTVLTTPESDQNFLQFVTAAEKRRQRWENAELECQRLTIELTGAAQEVTVLERKLESVRGMLEGEMGLRRRVEEDRDSLAAQLEAVRRLVLGDGEGGGAALHRLLADVQYATSSRHPASPQSFSPRRLFPSIHVTGADRTQDSVAGVEELSFDDTGDMCEDSPVLGQMAGASHVMTRHGRKRSRGAVLDPVEERSGGRRLEERDQERRQGERDEGKKKQRRSRSVGFRESSGARTRSRSLQVREAAGAEGSPAGHMMVQKTVLKSEKCGVCLKRLKFGKIVLRCSTCKLSSHTDCAVRMPASCGGLPPPASPTVVSRSPQAARGPRTPGPRSARQKFASPMLR